MFVVRTHPPAKTAGKRVLVRRYEMMDAANLHEAIVQSVDHLRPWMPWAALEPLELADREKLIADWLGRWDNADDFNFGIFEGSTVVGDAGSTAV